MKNEHQKYEPLMYIDQRNDRVADEPFMQKTYSSLQRETSQEVGPNESKNSNLPQRKRRHSVQRHMYTESIPTGEELGEEVDVKSNVVGEEQAFAELSLEEKVKYCTSTSTHIPKILCLIKTKERTIVGTIANFTKGIVHIRPQRSRTCVEVPIEDMISVRMTGF